MPTSPTKTLSPAELAKLEHAFATDPASDAYKPLAEAYLGMGRFMEAMVVCKKGVKAHPAVADPRLLLARVYAEQGKDKKAIEELMGALQVAPSDKHVLRMVGALQLKTGEADAGKGNLLKAFQADPSDAETKALLDQYKVELPKADPPTDRMSVNNGKPAAAAQASARSVPIAGPGAVPVAGPGTRREGARGSGASPAKAQVQRETRPALNGTPAPPRQTQPQQQAQRRTAERPPARPAYEEDDEESLPPRRQKKGGAGVTVVLALLLVFGVGGYAVFRNFRTQRNNEIKKQLREATELLRHDSYDAYNKANTAAKKALDADGSSVDAHGVLAYINAILWGEHGGGDQARQLAQEHLEEAKVQKESKAYVVAADALIKMYSGKSTDALNDLSAKIKEFDAKGQKSSTLYLTLSLLQMNAGDLERARESLETAQALASGDPRIYAAMGNLYRRRGEGDKAWNNYDFALRYENTHPESLLGKSLLILDQDEPQYIPAARMIKKLIDLDPPASPRQQAAAHMARALLVSRVSRDLPLFIDEKFKKELAEATGVTADKTKAQQEIVKEERDGVDRFPSDPELHLIKGRRLFLEGQFDGAVTELKEAIKLDPSRASSHVELARALMAKSNGEKEAIDALNNALKTVGESPKLLVMLGQAYRKANRLDEALSQLERAVRDPKAKNPDARMAMGAIHFQKEAWDRALASYDRAAQEAFGQSIKVAAAYTELGRVYEKKNDRAKADDAFKKALNADSNYTPEYFYYGAFMASDKRESAKAKTLLEEYMKREPKGPHFEEAKKLTTSL
ncbi:MAG: tetratricopeptide repeat protein [Myxococcaceae bacterium]